jgi:hypothetical protein
MKVRLRRWEQGMAAAAPETAKHFGTQPQKIYSNLMSRAVKVTRMSAWSITLRLVLMLALVLNGMATAMAGDGMAAGHEHALHTSAAASTSCHGQLANDISVEHGAHDHTAQVPDSHSDPGPDCCTPGTCQCACTHCAQVLTPVVAIAKPAFERLVRVDIPAAGHPAPALPNPIRPPIG